ncbi:MAG: SocA family protein [Sedimentisphaerales bacterium]|nr:SocA family protein [Sedimentisphaerales bacterium]
MGQVTFQFDREKATQAIVWLIKRNNGSMDKLQLVKLLFLADREHLSKYGRPIVGGSYYAMDYGPVSSQLLDYLNEPINKESAFIVDKNHTIIAQNTSGQEWLSQSDLDVLDEIYKSYGHVDKWKLRDITHTFAAYKKNEPSEGGRQPLPYEDFFLDMDVDAQKMLELILHEQEAWVEFD